MTGQEFPPEKCLENLMEAIAPGAILLMHDIYSTTPDTLRLLLPVLKEKGLQCVTLSELINTSEEDPLFLPFP